MTTELQEKIGHHIRSALEARLAQALKIETSQLPPLSLGEITSTLFLMYGHLNILGGFGESCASVRALVGDDLYWQRPKPKSEEPAASPTVQ